MIEALTLKPTVTASWVLSAVRTHGVVMARVIQAFAATLEAAITPQP